MSDILKIEYDLTLTLIVLPPPPTPCCHQACRHHPQGCGHAATLAVGTPSAAAALMPRCPLHFFALPPPLRCCRHCHVAAAAMPPPPRCHRRCTAAATALPLPPYCRHRTSRSNAAAAIPAMLLPPPKPRGKPKEEIGNLNGYDYMYLSGLKVPYI
jgi:hypothetical protein